MAAAASGGVGGLNLGSVESEEKDKEEGSFFSFSLISFTPSPSPASCRPLPPPPLPPSLLPSTVEPCLDPLLLELSAKEPLLLRLASASVVFFLPPNAPDTTDVAMTAAGEGEGGSCFLLPDLISSSFFTSFTSLSTLSSLAPPLSRVVAVDKTPPLTLLFRASSAFAASNTRSPPPPLPPPVPSKPSMPSALLSTSSPSSSCSPLPPP